MVVTEGGVGRDVNVSNGTSRAAAERAAVVLFVRVKGAGPEKFAGELADVPGLALGVASGDFSEERSRV